MTPVQLFENFRIEISEELAEATPTLVTERARLTVAETGYIAAKDAKSALVRFTKDAFQNLAINSGIAGPLYGRLVAAEKEIIQAASNELGAARASVKSLELRVAELQDALGQIDVALASAKHIKLRPTESTRRKAPPVEFDTIKMPKEAV